jgi:hypothetical protein
MALLVDLKALDHGDVEITTARIPATERTKPLPGLNSGTLIAADSSCCRCFPASVDRKSRHQPQAHTQMRG